MEGFMMHKMRNLVKFEDASFVGAQRGPANNLWTGTQHRRTLSVGTCSTVKKKPSLTATLWRTSSANARISSVVVATTPGPTMTVLVEDLPASEPSIAKALSELQAKKKEWAQLPVAKKIALLEAVRFRLGHKVAEFGCAGAECKGGTHEALRVTELLVSNAAPAAYIHRLLATLRSLKATGKAPALPSRTTATGQLAVQVFPVNWSDRSSLLQPGATGELWLRPEEKTVRQATLYGKDGTVAAHDGRVCAVLGAGNLGMLTLKDALVCLYERGEVVAVKPHPNMFAWHRVADYVLQPLIAAGYIRTLYLDSVEETQQLVYHPDVDCVHITGGTATHDAIVWGASPEERRRRRQANDPLLKVPITSELGCVTPYIVPSWNYTPAELQMQAADLVMSMTNNTGCNCNSAKVLVLPADWPQATAFLENVRAILRHTPLDPPYYPGIQQRYAAFKAHYPNCEVIEAPKQPACRPMGPHLPYLINHLDELPSNPKAEYAFNVEPFAPVLTVVRLPSRGPEEFLAAATRFVNDSLWGTLSCSLVLHPDLERAHPEAAQRAIAELRYGVISINVWAAASVMVGPCPWGAFVGDQTVADVGSGLGMVCNPYMVEGVQKLVYRVPFGGQATTKPSHMQPLPWAAAKAVASFLVNGWWGLLQALWWR